MLSEIRYLLVYEAINENSFQKTRILQINTLQKCASLLNIPTFDTMDSLLSLCAGRSVLQSERLASLSIRIEKSLGTDLHLFQDEKERDKNRIQLSGCVGDTGIELNKLNGYRTCQKRQRIKFDLCPKDSFRILHMTVNTEKNHVRSVVPKPGSYYRS